MNDVASIIGKRKDAADSNLINYRASVHVKGGKFIMNDGTIAFDDGANVGVVVVPYRPEITKIVGENTESTHDYKVIMVKYLAMHEASFTMKGGLISGFTEGVNYSDLLFATKPSKMVMNGGMIEKKLLWYCLWQDGPCNNLWRREFPSNR